MRFAFLLCGATVLALPNAAFAKTLPPKFECDAVKDFQPARQALLKAVKARDANALLALTSPNISWSFGDDDEGKPGFIRNWKLANPKTAKTSEIWVALDEVIKLGCSVDGGDIAMPHMFFRMTGSDQGVGIMNLVTGTKVNLRSSPSKTGKIITQLNWEVVEAVESGDMADGWQKVKTDAGQIGYVSSDFLRVDIDFRAIFRKEKGKWMMAAFIAGD
jgi:uncharacterized protein YgiM (DUF1202 family)